MATQLLLETVWFYLPAIAANMVPVIVHHANLWPALYKPLDGNRSWHGVRLLGNHKTVRGLVSGVTAALIIGYLQHIMRRYAFFENLSLVKTNSLAFALWLSFLLGFGALFGDSLKSFFKRRRGKDPGHAWIPFDQIDFVLGATLLTWWMNIITVAHVAVALIVLSLGSFVTSFVGAQMRIKRSI